jgi:hypothetical protein
MTDKEIMKLKKYDVALATRNFEIELFWKRSLFFWGFIASSFIGYATMLKNQPSLTIVIVAFGFICSLAWTLVNRGSKYWQENWEVIVADLEDDVTGSLFKDIREQKKKGIWLSSRKFSVSKVTIALSDFTVLIWLFLLFYHLICHNSALVIIVFTISIIFGVLMIIFGQSSDAKNS